MLFCSSSFFSLSGLDSFGFVSTVLIFSCEIASFSSEATRSNLRIICETDFGISGEESSPALSPTTMLFHECGMMLSLNPKGR